MGSKSKDLPKASMSCSQDERDTELSTVPEILLASRSPRRQELLQQIGLQYSVCHVETDESSAGYMMPELYVKEMAEQKALAALTERREDLEAGKLLLTADTALSFQGEIIGKPTDYSDFHRMMRKLSNRTHSVLSALTLVKISEGKPRFITKLNESEVEFSILSERFIEAYWRSGEPQDKAGGYAIQGFMAGFVRSISGSYSGIMGLPLFELREALEEHGYFLLPQ